MGASLRKMFGSHMVGSWFAFNQGSFQAMEMSRASRSIGAGYGEEFAANFVANQVTPKLYDALLFVEKTTAATPLGKGSGATP